MSPQRRPTAATSEERALTFESTEERPLLLVASAAVEAAPNDIGASANGSLVLCRFDMDSRLAVEARMPGPSQPLFALGHPSKGIAYVASLDDGGTIHAVDIGTAQIRSSPSGGQAPCHLAIAPDGSQLFCANYSGSSVSAHRLEADGQLGGMTALVDLSANEPQVGGSHPSRPHHVEVALGSTHQLFVTDLGRNSIVRFAAEPDGSLLALAGGLTREAMGVALGPRSLAWDAAGHLWCAEEHSSTVSRIRVGEDGTLNRTQTWPATSLAGAGRNYPGQIVASDDGRFAYVANRGSDTIRVYRACEGRSGPVQEVPCGGRWPAALVVHNGFLLVANRDSNTVTAFRIDPEDGTLGSARQTLSVTRPTSLTVVPVASRGRGSTPTARR